MSLLEIDGTEVVYGRVRATHGVSFAVEENEVVALVGSNGAGKSSTLKAVMGLSRLGAGTIRFDGGNIDGCRPFEVVRRGIGYSPEGRRVFPSSSVLDNLLAGGYVLERPALRARLAQVFDYFPLLKERVKQLAGSLSGGEQQMLTIGRALMSRPRLLLLDEPSLGLAPVIVQHIGAVVRDIQSAEKLAVVIAEQNSDWALRLADRGIVLEVGVVSRTGNAAELRRSDHVQRAYMGSMAGNVAAP
jgi:branched-chain amino acid transport system ATP-binding protein